MENKISVTDFIKELESTTFESLITRKYIPTNEKDDIISEVNDYIFSKIEDGLIVEYDTYKTPNLFMEEFFVSVYIIGAYTNIDTSDRTLVYDTFMENNLYEKLLELVPDANKFDIMLTRQISAKREFIKDSQKSSMDEVLESLNGLVLTLSDKASQLDVKKLDKLFKNINPQEIMKAYQNL